MSVFVLEFLMNKNITIEQIKTAFTLTKDLGINAKVLIMHGFPGDSYNTTKETIALLEELRIYI